MTATLAPRGRSLWTDARRRFARNRAAMVSAWVLLAVVIFASFGGLLARYDTEMIDWSAIGAAVAENGRPSLSNGHWFGVDKDGRDLYARTVQGTRLSLLVGVVGAAMAVGIGTLYGAIAGYAGGRIDGAMMRAVDILLSVPFLFVLILIFVVFERTVPVLLIGIAAISWLDVARIARGQTLSIKNKDFVEAAVAIGVPPLTIVLRHIVPNLLGIVVVYATLLIPGMIVTESFLSFIGLGVQEPMTSLGALISSGASQINNGVLWQLTFPLFFFIVTLFALFFVGDGLRDALDPKDR